MEAASLSDVGRMRTENQDACGEVFDSAGNRLLIVADGMGGHAGGSTASRICVETVCREFQDSSAALDVQLRLASQQANADVCEVAGENAELAGMGPTAVALALDPMGGAWVAWVGDSRAYRLRQGELQAITDDHSWVAEAVRMGVIAADEAFGGAALDKTRDALPEVFGLETLEHLFVPDRVGRRQILKLRVVDLSFHDGHRAGRAQCGKLDRISSNGWN